MAVAQASLRVPTNKVEQAFLLSRPSRCHSHHALQLPKSPLRRLPLRPLSAQAKAQPDTSTSLQQTQDNSPKPPALAQSPSLNFLDNWYPFSMSTRSLRQMMAAMDRVFGEISTPTMDFGYVRTPWDAVENDDSYEMRIDLPGFEKDEVNVHVEDGLLIVNACRNKERSDQQNKWSTRTRDSFRTEIALPKDIDVTKLSAKLNNGVLEIFIPRTKASKQVIDVKIE